MVPDKPREKDPFEVLTGGEFGEVSVGVNHGSWNAWVDPWSVWWDGWCWCGMRRADGVFDESGGLRAVDDGLGSEWG